jgi:hypothetical protein
VIAVLLLLLPLSLSDGTPVRDRLLSLLSLKEIKDPSAPHHAVLSVPFGSTFAQALNRVRYGHAFHPSLGETESRFGHNIPSPDGPAPTPDFAAAPIAQLAALPHDHPVNETQLAPRPWGALPPFMAITAIGAAGVAPGTPPSGAGTGPLVPPGPPNTPPGTVIVTPLALPESASWAAMILGLFGAGMLLRRRGRISGARSGACAASLRQAG